MHHYHYVFAAVIAVVGAAADVVFVVAAAAVVVLLFVCLFVCCCCCCWVWIIGTYSDEEVDAMLEEGLKLKHFRHQNVLNLIGVCVEASPAPYIVMPYMSNGSLLRYLRQEKLTLVLSNHMDEETVSCFSLFYIKPDFFFLSI